MNDLMIFENAEFGKIRTVEVEGKIYFVGNDIAKALEYARPYEAISAHCKGAVTYRIPTNGGFQESKVIPEGDIYRLIVKASDQSKNKDIKDKAARFESWVFDNILPSIRKHGMYAVDELLDDPDLAIKAFTALKEEREKNRRLQAENSRMKPKEIFADAVSTSHTSILIGDLAKLLKQNGYETGQKRLFEMMRSEGFLIKNGDSKNMPTQRSMEMGLFEVKETTITNSDGSIRITKTTKVTGKGQLYFINRFLNRKIAG